MRRHPEVWGQVVSSENLRLAFHRAAKDKRQSRAVTEYAQNLNENLEDLRAGLLSGDYPIDRFHRFMVHGGAVAAAASRPLAGFIALWCMIRSEGSFMLPPLRSRYCTMP